MKVERDLHMSRGDGETSYASNSRLQVRASPPSASVPAVQEMAACMLRKLFFFLQEKSILKTRPVLHEAVAAARASASLSSAAAMVVADLGCSSGPNTLLVVSEVLGAVATGRRREAEELRLVTGGQQPQPPAQHVQFFLNDLPGNDFNLVFQSLELFKKLAARDKGDSLPPYYVAGLPGSFYTRLFPDRSVHLFHSSYCLMWRSKARTNRFN